MHYNYIYRFCPVCGAGLKSKMIKENEPARLLCSKCGFVFYLDPKLVACTVVEMERKIILLKRGHNPEKGKWVIPGGYVDRGEEVKAAALRETREECGIEVKIKKLLGVYSYSGWLEVMVVYLAEYVSGDLIAGDESTEVKLLEPMEIPWDNLAFRSTQDVLRDYCGLKGECDIRRPATGKIDERRMDN
jgi:ADP-ribose pyrophosphatase YjhB (NUDIX family)